MPRLLLADDSVTIQRVIELTFADEDVEVVAVGDGDAAIARLESDPPDIVLADVGMPGRDGYEVAAYVKRSPGLAHIPVLLLAGAFEPVDEARVAETGCAGVLVKPFEPQMVIARVRGLLARRQTSPRLVETRPVTTDLVPSDPMTSSPLALHAPSADPGPPAPNAARSATVDDYFDRLDAAFASINAHFDDPKPRAVTAHDGDAARRGDAAGPLGEKDSPAPAAPAAVAPLSMADAFGALLGVEQGVPPPILPDAWAPVVTDDLVDQVARRVADQVGERLVRELAPEIVTRVAERLVREEIAKLRSEAEE
jgi:CheY-like chemotaxis protein